MAFPFNEIYLCKQFIISSTANILFSPVEYLKGVGPLRGELLKKEAGIFTFKDMLEYFPFRHIDKTRIDKIASLGPDTEYAQVAGRLTHVELIGEKRSRRLVAYLQDDTGELELVWFQGISWAEKLLGKPVQKEPVPEQFGEAPAYAPSTFVQRSGGSNHGKKHMHFSRNSTERKSS